MAYVRYALIANLQRISRLELQSHNKEKKCHHCMLLCLKVKHRKLGENLKCEEVKTRESQVLTSLSFFCSFFCQDMVDGAFVIFLQFKYPFLSLFFFGQNLTFSTKHAQ